MCSLRLTVVNPKSNGIDDRGVFLEKFLKELYNEENLVTLTIYKNMCDVQALATCAVDSNTHNFPADDVPNLRMWNTESATLSCGIIPRNLK